MYTCLPVFPYILAVALDPGGAQRLLLHAEEVACPGVHLVEGARVQRFLNIQEYQEKFR